MSPDVQPRRQEKGTNCWLTCLEMLFQWKRDKGDTTKDPSSICSSIDRSPNLWSQYMVENGIAPYECRETARLLGLQAAGDGEIYADTLETVLKQKGPIWIAGRWYNNCDHVIVITGVDVQQGKVKFINPWRNYSLQESNGTISWLNERGSQWKSCDASVMYWK